jgi:hypothetical protein
MHIVAITEFDERMITKVIAPQQDTEGKAEQWSYQNAAHMVGNGPGGA